jgi:hypothetical protein
MGVGTSLGALHVALGWDWFAGPLLHGGGVTLPVGLSCAAFAVVAYRAVPSRRV